MQCYPGGRGFILSYSFLGAQPTAAFGTLIKYMYVPGRTKKWGLGYNVGIAAASL